MADAPAFRPDAPARRRLWPWLLAALVILFGIALRFVYHDSHHGWTDEQITIEVVKHMRQSGDWDVNWIKADLPPDLKYDQYNFSTHLYATYFFYRVTKWIPGTAGWRGRDQGFSVYRFFVAALGALCVVQTFLLGRRIGGFAVGVGAALLVGVSTLLVQDSHYVRPEPLCTTLTLALAGLSLASDAAVARRVIVAGFVVGLLIGCKVSMLLLAWLPFVPLLVQWRIVSRPWLLAVGVAAATVLGFAAGAPGAFFHPREFLNGVQHLATQYGGLHPPHSHLNGGPMGDVMAVYFIRTLGWPLVFAAGWGAYSLLRDRRWLTAAVLLVPCVAFFGYFATKSVFFERNVSHVLPFLLIVAALGVCDLARMFAARTRLAAVAVAIPLFLVVSARPAEVTWRLLGIELAGVGAERHDKLEQVLRDRYPNVQWWRELLLNDEPLHRLRQHFRAHGQPVLLRIADLADEGTNHNLRRLFFEFELEPLADFNGTFPEMPTCTLVTYHSSHDRYYLVRGLKPPP